MRVLFLTVLLSFFPLPATAQPLAAAQGDAPVEISAAEALEWDRGAKTYTARRDALAKQGDFEVRGDAITARYREESGATDIWQMESVGHVVISNPPYTAYGDKAVYDVQAQTATLTGRGLKISTPSETLTARDRIEFFGSENRLIATGEAVAVRGTDRLQADTLSAFFKPDAKTGKMALDRITAEGHVSIRTQRETVTGDRGTYDVPAGKAVLTGTVRILQGDNMLEGNRAETDLATGISRLFADGDSAGTVGEDGRVKGVFYPKKQPGNGKTTGKP